MEATEASGVRIQSRTKPPATVEGRAEALAHYSAKDPAGRDIDLEKGEVSLQHSGIYCIHF